MQPDPFDNIAADDGTALDIFCGPFIESDEAKANRLWLDEMEAQYGWFSASDER